VLSTSLMTEAAPSHVDPEMVAYDVDKSTAEPLYTLALRPRLRAASRSSLSTSRVPVRRNSEYVLSGASSARTSFAIAAAASDKTLVASSMILTWSARSSGPWRAARTR